MYSGVLICPFTFIIFVFSGKKMNGQIRNPQYYTFLALLYIQQLSLEWMASSLLAPSLCFQIQYCSKVAILEFFLCIFWLWLFQQRGDWNILTGRISSWNVFAVLHSEAVGKIAAMVSVNTQICFSTAKSTGSQQASQYVGNCRSVKTTGELLPTVEQ